MPTQPTVFLVQLSFDVMLREIYSIIRIKVPFKTTAHDNLSYRMQIHAICILLAIFHLAASNAEEHGKKDLLESVVVDTKYWAQDTEFGRKSNWANDKKPCTLLERIQVNEEAVISVGDSFDGVDGQVKSFDIRELALPMNSMLLLEQDSNLSESIDRNYIVYLDGLHDCWQGKDFPDDADQVFTFAPDSDSMSWFNPDNWQSQLYSDHDDAYYYILPDAYRIPCSDDTVVFGDRRFDLATLETNERSGLLSFKINFKPSKWSVKDTTQRPITNIKMGRLEIGAFQYNQTEFEQLHEQYGNTLFDRAVTGEGTSADQSVSLIIDDSSTEYNGHRVYDCSEKAGCICGNEDSEKLQAICSFNELVDIEDQPCHDPLPSIGYCNNICGTVLTMSIDPTKFSELFLIGLAEETGPSIETDQYHTIACNPRRVSETRYEMNFINIPTENYERSFGIEQIYANKLFQALNNPAIKSFYGIRSISMRSSIDWKRSNKNDLFWVSFIIISLSFLIMNIYGKDSGHYDWMINKRTIMTQVNHWMDYRFASRATSGRVTPITMIGNDQNADEDVGGSNGSGSLVEIALVDFDDRSNIVDDKANLIPNIDNMEHC